MKRTIDSIKEGEVVWCKSPEEAEKFVDLVYKSGKGDSYTNPQNCKKYPGELCYDVNEKDYGSREFCKNNGYKVTPATEFIEKENEQWKNENDHDEEEIPVLAEGTGEPSMKEMVKEIYEWVKEQKNK